MTVLSPPQSRQQYLGVAAAIAAAFAFATMNLGVLASGHRMSPAACLAARGVCGTVVLAPWAWREIPTVLTRRGWPIWLHCIFGALAAFALFNNLNALSVGEAVAFSYLAPIFVALIAPALFGECFSPWHAAGVALMIVGSVCVQGSHGVWQLAHTTLIGLGGAACGGAAQLTLKRAAQSHSAALVAWTFCLFAWVTAVVVSPSLLDADITNTDTWVRMLAVGALGTAGQILLSWSFKRLAAGIAGALSLSTLVFSVLLESLYTARWPLHLQVAGYTLICFGLVVLQAQLGRSANIMASEPERAN